MKPDYPAIAALMQTQPELYAALYKAGADPDRAGWPDGRPANICRSGRLAGRCGPACNSGHRICNSLPEILQSCAGFYASDR